MRRNSSLLVAALVLAACSSGPTSADPPILSLITISPRDVFLNATGQERLLVAVAKDQFGEVMSTVVLNWSSNNPTVASVNSQGMVRAESASCLALVTAGASNGRGGFVVSNAVSVEVLLPGTTALPAAGGRGGACGRSDGTP